MTLVLQSGDLINGKGARIPGATVVVEGTRISAVGPGINVPALSSEDEVIDARGLTVVPGLIDLHVHLHGQAGPNADPHLLIESNAYLAVILAENARKTLEAGFTTIRDMGAPNDINIDLARAIADGVIDGPLGSDCGAPFTPNGTNAVEMEFFVRYGATPMQAIEAGTRVAAEVLGMADRLGTVESGKEADLVILKEDPLKDIKALQKRENVLLVVQAGRIVVDRRNGNRRVS